MLAIYPNARTTPAVRAEIGRSAEPTGVLAPFRASMSWRGEGPWDMASTQSWW